MEILPLVCCFRILAPPVRPVRPATSVRTTAINNNTLTIIIIITTWKKYYRMPRTSNIRYGRAEVVEVPVTVITAVRMAVAEVAVARRVVVAVVLVAAAEVHRLSEPAVHRVPVAVRTTINNYRRLIVKDNRREEDTARASTVGNRTLT